MNNENAKHLNFRKGSKPRSPSQMNGNANINIKIQSAIPNLQNLAEKYIGVKNPHGFLTDLRLALGLPTSNGASKYGVITIPKEDGNYLQASLRITNHNSNARTYITKNMNMEYNLSIVVRRNQRKNTFKPHNNVVLDEYVYYGKNMERVENPLTQIINSIIGFLQSGVYEDTTNVAFKNQSPQQQNNNKVNCNKDMNKKLIRLTESDLHRIIKESVNKVLNEVWDIDDKGIVDYDEYGRAKNRSYADMKGLDPKLPSDTKRHLMNTPHRDARAETNYQHRFSEPNEFSDDTGKTIRPSGWFVRGSDGWYSDEFKDFDRQSSKLPKMNKAFDTADKRPLHRKGSLNREL